MAQEIAKKHGFRPLSLGLLDETTFYFYMMLESDGQTVSIPLPEALDAAGVKRAIEAALKRMSSGFLRTVAVYAPISNPQMAQFGMESGPAFEQLRRKLGEDTTLRATDLKSGVVPNDADLLLVLSPESLDEKQVFAIDQFTMQGGTVIIAASPYHIEQTQESISAQPKETGLENWLGGMGIVLDKSMVLDPQNTPFPIPVQRNLGGFTVQELRTIPYPYFPDLRGKQLDRTNTMTASLGQLTLSWASPIKLDQEKNKDRKVIELLHSSQRSWTSSSANIQPDFTTYGEQGFPVGNTIGANLLGVAIEGSFDSYFKGKPSPLLKGADKTKEQAKDEKKEDASKEKTVMTGKIDHSPASARIVLFGSAYFLSDTALDLAAEATGTHYIKPLQLVQNAVDWSLEDQNLLALRGRGQYSRMLMPMDRSAQMFWEYLNYALALAGLALVYGLQRRSRTRRLQHYNTILSLRSE